MTALSKMKINRHKFTFLSLLFLLFLNSSLALAGERTAPNFRITGYVEKINSGSIKIFVPRMKQSLELFLAKNLRVIDFATQKDFSLNDLKEKDMAVCEGKITTAGFVCHSIAFVRQSNIP